MAFQKKLCAYYIFTKTENNDERSICSEFLNHITLLEYKDRWRPELKINNLAASISKPTWLDGFKSRYLYGKFVEAKLLDGLELIDQNGEEETLNIPEGKGEKSEFYFILCPDKQVALVEQKRGCETKITNFFSRHWETYKKNNPTLPMLWFESKAITIKDKARDYLKDKAISNIQFSIDCSTITQQSAFLELFPGLGNLINDNQQLMLNLGFSTLKRSTSIQSVTVSKLVDFLESIENENILRTAACNEMIENRKSNKPTKLMDIYLQKDIYFKSEDEMLIIFKEELDNIIDELKI